MATPTIQEISALRKVVVREGVKLRPLRVSDATALLEILHDDPSIRERVHFASRIRSGEDIAAILDEEKQDGDKIRYVICEHEIVSGMVNFWRAGEYFGDKGDPSDYGFGYFLAPSARGRGLVTDSLKALMDIAVKELGATAFIAFCEADNAASGALLKKAGLEPTGETWVEPENGWVEKKYRRKV